jgi:hypothetical protein
VWGVKGLQKRKRKGEQRTQLPDIGIEEENQGQEKPLTITL